MLILSRRENESIVINDEIEVTIIEISDGKVRIGLNAPKEMGIYRKEIYEKIKEEMKLAADGRGRLESLGKLASED